MPKVPVSNETLLLTGVVYPDGPDGCWLRTLGIRPGTFGNGGGYSRLYRQGKTVYAHRLAYETWVGPIPQGKQIDHLCRHRSCINATHLEPVTPQENQSRGETNASKTQCPRGHPYDIVTSQGSRWCSICHASAQRQYRKRKSG